MNKVLNSEEDIMHNYGSLNMYSWFLYLADKEDEALKYNKYTQTALENSPEYGFFNSNMKKKFIQGLQQQAEEIRKGTWQDPDFYEDYGYQIRQE
ncbi:hypothetical protein FACS189434_00960 [Bacteroidia bacterium]|nr:hypothetical protein FACS189434_00960 [Bacteroidia bacterium]